MARPGIMAQRGKTYPLDTEINLAAAAAWERIIAELREIRGMVNGCREPPRPEGIVSVYDDVFGELASLKDGLVRWRERMLGASPGIVTGPGHFLAVAIGEVVGGDAKPR